MPRGETIRPHHDGFLPGRHAIDAYGGGGFRFGEMSHRGSILALPSGVRAWTVASFDALSEASLAAVLAEKDAIDTLLIGAGAVPAFLSEDLRWALRAAGFVTDVMTTPAAVRTYNVMLAEDRRVAGALIAVS